MVQINMDMYFSEYTLEFGDFSGDSDSKEVQATKAFTYRELSQMLRNATKERMRHIPSPPAWVKISGSVTIIASFRGPATIGLIGGNLATTWQDSSAIKPAFRNRCHEYLPDQNELHIYDTKGDGESIIRRTSKSAELQVEMNLDFALHRNEYINLRHSLYWRLFNAIYHLIRSNCN